MLNVKQTDIIFYWTLIIIADHICRKWKTTSLLKGLNKFLKRQNYQSMFFFFFQPLLSLGVLQKQNICKCCFLNWICYEFSWRFWYHVKELVIVPNPAQQWWPPTVKKIIRLQSYRIWLAGGTSVAAGKYCQVEQGWANWSALNSGVAGSCEAMDREFQSPLKKSRYRHLMREKLYNCSLESNFAASLVLSCHGAEKKSSTSDRNIYPSHRTLVQFLHLQIY